GIEPALVAWKATVLPLNYSRPGILQTVRINEKETKTLVEGGGLLRASCPPPLRGQPFAVFGLAPANPSNQHSSFGGSHPPPSSADSISNLVEGGGFEPPKAWRSR